MAFDAQKFKELAQAEGYSPEEVDAFLVQQARIEHPPNAANLGPTGAPLGPHGMPSGSDVVEKPSVFMDPVEIPALLFAGPESLGAKAVTKGVGSVASRLAPRVAAGSGGTIADAVIASEAGGLARQFIGGARGGAEGLPVIGPVLRGARRGFEGAGEAAGRVAQEAPQAVAEAAQQVEQKAGAAIGRIGKEVQRHFPGASTSEKAGKYLIHDEGGVLIGKGKTLKEAIEDGYERLGEFAGTSVKRVRKAFRGPAERVEGKVVGEIKPAVKGPAKAVPAKGSAASRTMSAEEQAAARAKGREIAPTKSPHAMQGKSNAKLAREAKYREGLKAKTAEKAGKAGRHWSNKEQRWVND